MTAESPLILIPPVKDPVYADWAEWFDQYFRHLFPADPNTTPGFCPEWRSHRPATFALEGLWRSWEALQADPGSGLAKWATSFAIPWMAELLDERGTFAVCSGRAHHESEDRPLPNGTRHT